MLQLRRARPWRAAARGGYAAASSSASSAPLLRVVEGSAPLRLEPVGALTQKPNAFMARPWELRHVQSIDVFDAVGSNTRVDFKDTEIIQIVPRLNDDINEEWITDKARFAWDGLKRQRLDNCYLSGKQQTWRQASAKAVSLLQEGAAVVCGHSLDLEAMTAGKALADMLSAPIYTEAPVPEEQDLPPHFSSPVSMADLVTDTDAILLVGINPKLEATLLNVRLRGRWRQGQFSAMAIGAPYALTYATDFIGLTPADVVAVAEGRHPACKTLAKAKRPAIVYGSAVVRRDDGAALAAILRSMKRHLPNLVVAPVGTTANEVGAASLGLPPFKGDVGDAKTVYMIGVNDTALVEKFKAEGRNVIYQGTHGDEAVRAADLVLPGVTFVEKEGTYLNFEGRPQRTALALKGPKVAREDWQIVRALAQLLAAEDASLQSPLLACDDMESMRALAARYVPAAAMPGTLAGPSFAEELSLAADFADGPVEVFAKTAIKPALADHFRNELITKSSTLMAKVSKIRRDEHQNFVNLICSP